jgi:hypothetical protein
MTNQSTQFIHERPVGHVLPWTLAGLGFLAAMIGLWVAVAPEGGTLTFINQTWRWDEIPEFWAPTLLLAGGGTAALAMAVVAVRDWSYRSHRSIGVLEGVLALAGLAAVVLGIFVIL